MDSSGAGSGNPPRISSGCWTAPQEPSTPGQSPPRRLQQAAPLHSPARGTLRGSITARSYPRSISLPQALHNLTLSNRSGYKKATSSGSDAPSQSPLQGSLQGNPAADTAGQNHMPVLGEGAELAFDSYTRDTKHGAYTQESIYSNGSYAYDIRSGSSRLDSGEASSSVMLSPPSPSAAKRVASENHQGPKIELRRFPRSETTTHIAQIVHSGETQLLDPLPHHGEFSMGMHAIEEHHSAALSYNVADCLHYNEVEAGSFKLNSGSLKSGLADRPRKAVEQALSNPDILKHIFEALDAMTVIPHELVQQRRKPLSLRHAQLIFGDNKHAVEAWEQSQPTTTGKTPGAGLYNCLFVNSAWYDAAVRVLDDRIHFCVNESWTKFARRGVSALSRKPRMLVLHKLSDATQVELDMIDHANLGENLQWLEFYTCVGLAPPASLIGPELTRIILPGCYRVNDRTLAQIAMTCSRLEHLDVRACEQVSDRGIKMISKYCPLLKLINVGRTRAGEQITYKGIKHLARQTQITTLGIAGCNIDDRAIWELALNRGPELQRLSLNNCRLLTDASIPRVLGYMPNLTVLEIRGCVQMTHMRPIALFKAYREKQGQPPLIEGCEVIERRLQIAIMKLQRETSYRILSELSSWVNSEDDD